MAEGEEKEECNVSFNVSDNGISICPAQSLCDFLARPRVRRARHHLWPAQEDVPK